MVDVQVDFLPGGALAVPEGDQVIPLLNRSLALFQAQGLPIFATRDWHPPDHCSFSQQSGPWPPHCVAGTRGAEFAPGLELPPGTAIISKGTSSDRDAYSGFAGTDLAARLHALGVQRLLVGGLATDYCVLNTVKDAVAEGFETLVLRGAIRAVNVRPGDGARAEAAMLASGARLVSAAEVGIEAGEVEAE